MMIIDEAFKLGEVVYLKTDEEQTARIVTGIMIRPGDFIEYRLSCGTLETPHFAVEISENKSMIIN